MDGEAAAHGASDAENAANGELHSQSSPVSLLREVADDIRSVLGDSEEASAGILDDILDDIFDRMRITDENHKAIAAAVSSAWRDALDGCIMAGANAEKTMDGDGHDSDSQWHLYVRPRIDDDDDVKDASLSPKPRKPRVTHLNRPYAPVLDFLTRLWSVIDGQSTWVESQLALHPTSRFTPSAEPTVGRPGEWEIPVSDLRVFLIRIAHAARVSILADVVVDYVLRTNAKLLTKKETAKSWLQLHHIALCVHTALLVAEEEADADLKVLKLKTSTPTASHVFQTELLQRGDTPRDDDDELFAYYDEGSDPRAPSIDRNATGKVPKKTELHATVAKKLQLQKNIIALLQRRASSDSKWGVLRKRVLVRDQHVGIAVETDMVLSTSPTKDTKTASTSPKKKASVAASPTATTARMSTKDFSIEPDAATLSNIFSLGTPRQLSADELARRNDILSILERQEAQANRKMAVASIVAVSVPPPCVGPDGKPIMSDHDKAFQAYTAANSTITMTSGSCIMPEGGVTGDSTKQSKESRKSSDTANAKTKFDLALEPPRFEVMEGNTHALLLAAASPPLGKKIRGRNGTAAASNRILSTPTSPLPSSSKTPSPPAQHNYHPRPLETASGHLPQLDTSRLAVGVKAVQRGIEKRGPRHDPSRNSRLRLHNYVTNTDPADPIPTTVSVPQTKHSELPPVSPVKASPHRKHVSFRPPLGERDQQSGPFQPISPTNADSASPQRPSGSRRFPAKQATHEKEGSPPRIRNRHLSEKAADGVSRPKHYVMRQRQEDEDDSPAAFDPHYKALHAPRRNLVPVTNGVDDEN